MDKRGIWCSKKRNVSYVNEAFFEKWSNEMAYVLGFFAADGCLTKNTKRQNYYIEFVSTDLEILKKIKNVMNARQKITSKTHSKIRPATKQGYRIQIGSKKIFYDLVELGFSPKKSKSLIFPRIPDLFLSDFVRGYFDGDGCISTGFYKPRNRKRKRCYLLVRFTCRNQNFLQVLSEKLARDLLGNRGSIFNNNGSFDLSYSTTSGVGLLKYMYLNSGGLHLSRKYDKFVDVINRFGPVA